MTRIAVLGGGVMGETLASAFLRMQPRPELVVAEKRAERAQELVDRYGIEAAEPRDAVVGADVVILVVKPQDTLTLLDGIGADIASGTVVISIAAGITTKAIEDRIGVGVDVVRVMPNTPARIDLGMSGVSPGGNCTPAALAVAMNLMSAVGVAVEVPESLQDAVTAVSGSGPAYVFYLAEAMTKAAVEMGLDAGTATTMVNQTLLGAATLLHGSGESAQTLRENVTSPNGTTAAAIASMNAADIAGEVVTAMLAARDRSRELSGN